MNDRRWSSHTYNGFTMFSSFYYYSLYLVCLFVILSSSHTLDTYIIKRLFYTVTKIIRQIVPLSPYNVCFLTKFSLKDVNWNDDEKFLCVVQVIIKQKLFIILLYLSIFRCLCHARLFNALEMGQMVLRASAIAFSTAKQP